MSVAVPIVHEQDSSLGQVFHSLGVLESVVSDVFASVIARSSAEKEKLASLNARVRVMGQQIAQVAANKQMATCVTSPAKFPVATSQAAPMFTSSACQVIQAHLPAPVAFPKGHASSLPGMADVSELFLALDHSRQSLHTNVTSSAHSDPTLSSVSSLVPFGSKQLPEAIMHPKKPVELGPQPLATVSVAAERASFLFPRLHATPPSLGTPTDLPLPKLAWFSSVENKASSTSSTPVSSTLSSSSSSSSSSPSSSSVSSQVVSRAPTQVHVSVPPVTVVAVCVSPEQEGNVPVAPEFTELSFETKHSFVVELKAETKEMVIPPPVNSFISGGRGDLLRDIERQARAREQRRAEQQANTVVIHAAPSPSIALPLLNPAQDDALRRALEDRRRDVEEDNVWEPADEF